MSEKSGVIGVVEMKVFRVVYNSLAEFFCSLGADVKTVGDIKTQTVTGQERNERLKVFKVAKGRCKGQSQLRQKQDL